MSPIAAYINSYLMT